MSRQPHNGWVVLSPPFSDIGVARLVFREHARKLSELLANRSVDTDFDAVLKSTINALKYADRTAALRAALCVLTDLARQRWSIRVSRNGDVEVARPVGGRLDQQREKARIRAQELVKREEQLRESSTRKFIKGMEKKSVHGGHFVSIYSLIRDGRELADSLRTARKFSGAERASVLREAIDPYLQFVNEVEYCEHTGLRLQDIWRYFRHTWTNQYNSTPGRSMAFLVRDRARKFNPVIGIGALGSPIVQIRERDAWISWHPDAFMEFATEYPSVELGVWLNKTVQTALNELYIDDFIEEEILSPANIRVPTAEIVRKLTDYGNTQRELHRRLGRSLEMKRPTMREDCGSTRAHWQGRAKSHLYRYKRAFALADMLNSRMVLQKHLSTPPTLDEVKTLLASSDGRRIVRTVLRKAKADPSWDRDGRRYGVRSNRALQFNSGRKTRRNVGREPGSSGRLP